MIGERGELFLVRQREKRGVFLDISSPPDPSLARPLKQGSVRQHRCPLSIIDQLPVRGNKRMERLEFKLQTKRRPGQQVPREQSEKGKRASDSEVRMPFPTEFTLERYVQKDNKQQTDKDRRRGKR